MRTLCVACHHDVTAVQCAERRIIRANARKQLKELMNSMKDSMKGVAGTKNKVCNNFCSALTVGMHSPMVYIISDCRMYWMAYLYDTCFKHSCFDYLHALGSNFCQLYDTMFKPSELKLCKSIRFFTYSSKTISKKAFKIVDMQILLQFIHITSCIKLRIKCFT
jgi:hypothetical protein